MATVSGNVGIANASVCCTAFDGNGGFTSSDVNGNYSVSGLPADTYYVIPTLVGYSFSPTYQQVVVVASDVTGVNFTPVVAPAPTYVFTPVYTNSFTGSNQNPLDPTKWALHAGDPTTVVLQILNGSCQGTVLNTDADEYLTIPLPNNQYVRFTLESLVVGTGSFAQMQIRADAFDSQTTYNVAISDNGDNTFFLDVASGFNIDKAYDIFISPAISFSPGDVFTFGVYGSTLFLYQNSTLLLNNVDPLNKHISGFVGIDLTPVTALTDVTAINFEAGSVTITGAVYSQPDCRNYATFPNSARSVNATLTYDVQTSSDSSVPGVDSRAAGAPVASGTYPQNSRTPGTFGPGE